MGIRDYFKGGPVLRNPRIIESLAAASHDRMAEVKADRRLFLLVDPPAGQPYRDRANLTQTAVGLQRYWDAREHANDNTPVRAPANDKAKGHER